jgi:hypothetical protein
MSDVIIREKTDYHTRTTEQMERHLLVPPWSLRRRSRLPAGFSRPRAMNPRSLARSLHVVTGPRPTGCSASALASMKRALATLCWSTTISISLRAMAW